MNTFLHNHIVNKMYDSLLYRIQLRGQIEREYGMNLIANYVGKKLDKQQHQDARKRLRKEDLVLIGSRGTKSRRK